MVDRQRPLRPQPSAFSETGLLPKARFLFLALAGASLLAAVWGGLIRLGWPLPTWQPALMMMHGPLMIGGCLGTLISLERAVALGQRWMFVAPLSSGAGALLLVLGAPVWLSALSITAGSLVLLAVIHQIWRIHKALHTGAIGLGVLLWVIGNGVWLGGAPLPYALPWWMAFLVLTIAGERLELSRLLRLSFLAYSAFGAAVMLLLAGLLASLSAYALGVRLAGAGFVALALWLLHFDIAWRRLKAGGQARFIATSLLSGYIWLALGGGLHLVYGGATAGPYYDAMLHSVLLGFVFAMIFAHAPIIIPAILKTPTVYTPWWYSHLVLLHLTLALRISGDLALWQPGRQAGGLLNGVTLLLFLANTLLAVRRSQASQM